MKIRCLWNHDWAVHARDGSTGVSSFFEGMAVLAVILLCASVIGIPIALWLNRTYVEKYDATCFRCGKHIFHYTTHQKKAHDRRMLERRLADEHHHKAKMVRKAQA